MTDEKISDHDAEEIRRFRSFIREAGPPGSKQGFEAWRKYYPEDYAKAMAEYRARQEKEGSHEAME